VFRFAVSAESGWLTPELAIRYRTTTARLNVNRGSLQYQAMNVSMANSSLRREWTEASVLSTAAFDCSSSGIVSLSE
jgi:hypothetical protein